MFTQEAKTAVVLSDGALIAVNTIYGTEPKGFQMVVDTNGEKGPNTLGRDLFTFRYQRISYDSSEFALKASDEYNPETKENCDSTDKANYTQGVGCVDRLLIEGAMNY